MAAFTSKATGNWSASGQTTWNETGVPANGDSVTIGTGHAITVDVDTTVGTSPGVAGTTAIRVNTTGTLTIAAGITLVCRGDILLNNTTLTLAAGSILEFDASAASSPSTAIYFLQISTADNQASSLLVANGTSGSRCTIRSNSGGANARIGGGGPYFGGGKCDLTYCDLTRIGDATHSALDCSPFYTGNLFKFQHCVLDACGRIRMGDSPHAGATILFSYVTMKNTVYDRCATLKGPSGSFTTGSFQITNCVFDKYIEISPSLEVAITGTLFMDEAVLTSQAWGTFSGNLVRGADDILSVYNNISDCYFLADGGGAGPHFINLDGARAVTVDGCVFEFTGTGNAGDCILCIAPAASQTRTIKNCHFLPNADGDDSGTPFTLGGGANLTVALDHNTYFVGVQGAVVGETYAGHAGMLSSFKNNLAWDTSARGYKLFDSGSDDSVSDLVTSANADYNAGYNVLAGSNLKGYNHLEFSSGSPGAHDVDAVDPQFVDSARDIASWDAALGGAGTVANALVELAKINDAAGYNSAYTIAALVTWVKAGFAPQSTLLKAASDNVAPSYGWIGAMTGVPAVETGLSDPTAQRAGGGWV